MVAATIAVSDKQEYFSTNKHTDTWNVKHAEDSIVFAIVSALIQSQTEPFI